jgi:hypothetical protein
LPPEAFLFSKKINKKLLRAPLKRISLVATSDRRFAGGARQTFEKV